MRLDSATRWLAQRWHHSWRRWSLWSALVLLVAATLVTQVWLAGRYEVSEVQQRLDREAADAVGDIRTAFNEQAAAGAASWQSDTRTAAQLGNCPADLPADRAAAATPTVRRR